MNSKKFVILVVGSGLVAISTANVQAQMHRNAGFASHATTSHSFARSGGGTFYGHNWGGGDWHHHHHGGSGSTIFIGCLAFLYIILCYSLGFFFHYRVGCSDWY